MGIYSNLEIRADLASGNIVIEPYNHKHVNGSSYDVTLGQYFYRSGSISHIEEGDPHPSLYNPYNEEEVDEHFGALMEAEPFRNHSKAIQALGVNALNGIEPNHPVIVLRPGERILAHTNEFIGIKQGTTSMQARSTTGRNGIVVCMDAGWGDPGYVNRWTMEILNHNEQWIVLPVGIRIAQIVFHHTGIVDGEYSQLSGKYQKTSSDDLITIKKMWTPAQMKPRGFKDELEPLTPVSGLSKGLK